MLQHIAIVLALLRRPPDRPRRHEDDEDEDAPSEALQAILPFVAHALHSIEVLMRTLNSQLYTSDSGGLQDVDTYFYFYKILTAIKHIAFEDDEDDNEDRDEEENATPRLAPNAILITSGLVAALASGFAHLTGEADWEQTRSDSRYVNQCRDTLTELHSAFISPPQHAHADSGSAQTSVVGASDGGSES